DCNADPADGCEADLASADTCGGCGTVCADPAHASASCGASGCTFTCELGWEDCNGDPADGCEADLTAPATCGSCTTACSGATPLCESGSCVTGCTEPTPTLCGSSCVNTDNDAANCSECGTVCPDPDHASPVCVSGACG